MDINAKSLWKLEPVGVQNIQLRGSRYDDHLGVFLAFFFEVQQVIKTILEFLTLNYIPLLLILAGMTGISRCTRYGHQHNFTTKLALLWLDIAKSSYQNLFHSSPALLSSFFLVLRKKTFLLEAFGAVPFSQVKMPYFSFF